MRALSIVLAAALLQSAAFAQQREPDGTRRATSADGRVRLRLFPPADGSRATIDDLSAQLLKAPPDEQPDLQSQIATARLRLADGGPVPAVKVRAPSASTLLRELVGNRTVTL